MEQDQKPKYQISDLASILVLIGACILANIASIMWQRGAFNIWISLSGLPSPAIQIINADPDNIWVKSTDKQVYTANIDCPYGLTCSYKWNMVHNVAGINPAFAYLASRKDSCEKFDTTFPKNPSGTVVECIRAILPPMPEGGGYNSYFALMSDGTIKFWRLYNGHYLTPFICAGIVSLFCPTIALLLATVLYPRIKSRAG